MAHGQEGIALWVGSWLFPPHPTCHRHRHPLHTHQAMLPHGWRKLAQWISQGEWGAGVLGPGVARLSGWAEWLSVLPDPCFALPPSGFPHKYCSHNFRKLKGKNKGSHGASFLQYHLLHSPKPAQEKLTPSCPEPFVTP